MDAVVRNLKAICEAARALPEKVKANASDVDRRRLIGLRNVLIHECFGISLPIIWDIVANRLDELEAACRRMADDLG